MQSLNDSFIYSIQFQSLAAPRPDYCQSCESRNHLKTTWQRLKDLKNTSCHNLRKQLRKGYKAFSKALGLHQTTVGAIIHNGEKSSGGTAVNLTGRENYSKSTSMTDPGGQNRTKNKRTAGITSPQLRSVFQKGGQKWAKMASTGEFQGKKHTDG